MLPVIVPISDNTWHLGNFVDSDYIENYPKEILYLVNSATPDKIPRWYGKLDEVLDKIGEADPSLMNEPEFKRLEKIIVENNLM